MVDGEAPLRLLLVSNKSNAGYNIAPPIGLYQLHSYVAASGVDSTVLDRELVSPEPFVERTAAGEFDVIGFSVSHDNMLDDLDLLWRFRRAARQGGRRCLFIAGGQEAALNYGQWLGLGIDVCFLGFAEKVLAAFCQRVAAQPAATIPELCAGLAGVAFRDAAGEPRVHLSTPLTSGEFRELFYDHILTLDVPYGAYWTKLRDESADTTLGASRFVIENVRLYTTSHCPRRCGFCNSQSFLPEAQGGKLAIIGLSAAEIVDLILSAVDRYGARGFLFSDDDFPIGNKAGIDRVLELCDRILALKEEGRLPRDLAFACQARVADFLRSDGTRRWVDRRLMDRMVAAGFGSIGLGVESFCDRILRAPSVFKIAISGDDCARVLAGMLGAGLKPQINLILGIPEYLPDELADTMATAVDFLVRGCDIAVTRHLDALPGAPIYGADLYPLRYKHWRHPDTGDIERIADYFVPNDAVIRSVSERFDVESAAELARVVESRGWEGKIVHKRVVGLCSLIAVASLLGRQDLERRFRGVLDDVLEPDSRREGRYTPLPLAPPLEPNHAALDC